MGLPDRFQTACRIAVVAAGLLTVRPTAAQSPQNITAYFDALRERGLYGVAERYGLDRRNELPRDSAESVQLAVELSRTLARHALIAETSDEQAFLRQRAEEVLGDYRESDRVPRLEALLLEKIHRQIDRAELAWWIGNAAPADRVLRTAAIDQISAARAALADWIERGTDSAATPAAARDAEDLTRRELAAMLHQARVKAIDLLLLNAEMLEIKADRERLIRLADDTTKPLVASGEKGTTATLKLFAIRGARLAGDEQELKSLVRQASTDRMPATLRQEATAELARFELDHAHYEAAAQLLVNAKSAVGESSDRLRGLHVEAVIGMADRAGADRAALLASAQSENDLVPAPWRLKNDALLQIARDTDKYGAQAALILQQGHREFRAGRRSEAIAAYRQAATASTAPAGRAELRFMTASLLVEARQFSEALTECDLVLRNAPSPSVAARASLLAAYCRGQIWSASRHPADRQSYQSALTEHLNRFAADETSGDAAWMLGSLAEQAGDWSAVVDADHRIPPAHPRAAESLARSVRAAQSALDEIRAAGGKTSGNKTPEQWSAEAQLLASRLLKPGGRDLLAARRILAAATLLAAMPQPDFSRILNLLDQIPSPPPETDAEKWQQLGQEAAALRLVCLTSTGQFADAAATLEQLRSISLTELLTVLRNLSDSGRQLGGQARAELGQLEIKTIQRIRLQGAALSPSEQQLLLECEAEALFATGQYDEAAKMFGQAAIAKSGLLPRVAESLTLTGKKDDLQRARGLWQQIAAKEKQGTRPWFEARLKLARVLVALGQKNDCRQLIATTRIIYEDLGGPDLKQAFDTLEQETAGP